MLNISRTSKYALQGLLYLAKHREVGFVKIDEISKEEGIPVNYLRKIFQQLIKNKVVESVVGPRGGVKLPDGPNEFSLAQVIKIFDGEPTFDECSLFGTKGCTQLAECPLHGECFLYDKSVWEKLDRYKVDKLSI